MTVTEKLAHAAERKAFETMLDSLIRKSRTQDVGKVADDLVSMVQKIHSSVWEPETFAMLHKIANDPNSKWAHYAERLLRECDPYLLRTFLTAAAYDGGFRGFHDALALQSGNFNHFAAQLTGQLRDVDLIAVLADHVHHVDGDDHGDAQLGELRR